MKPNLTDYLHLHYAINKMSPQILVVLFFFFSNHSSFVDKKDSIKNISIYMYFFADEKQTEPFKIL